MRGSATWLAGSLLALGLLAPALAHAQQAEMGHKLPGTLGIDAGTQVDPGLYLLDRFLWYSASQVRDRHGNVVPVGLDADALSNSFGVALVLRLGATYYSASAAVPVTRLRASSQRPETSLDRFGLADIYLQPMRLGWRGRQWDLVVGYAAYAPTGQFAPFARSLGQGQWSHEFSGGGTAYFDRGRTWTLSALGSYGYNLPKRDIDIRRGNTVQVQAGFGKKLSPLIQPGLTGYALWQVSDDSGRDLPAVLLGARDQVFGLGAQVNVFLPIRMKATVSYSHDILARSRPVGQLLLVGISFVAWKPGG